MRSQLCDRGAAALWCTACMARSIRRGAAALLLVGLATKQDEQQ
jgi:hypothetical protein